MTEIKRHDLALEKKDITIHDRALRESLLPDEVAQAFSDLAASKMPLARLFDQITHSHLDVADLTMAQGDLYDKVAARLRPIVDSESLIMLSISSGNPDDFRYRSFDTVEVRTSAPRFLKSPESIVVSQTLVFDIRPNRIANSRTDEITYLVPDVRHFALSDARPQRVLLPERFESDQVGLLLLVPFDSDIESPILDVQYSERAFSEGVSHLRQFARMPSDCSTLEYCHLGQKFKEAVAEVLGKSTQTISMPQVDPDSGSVNISEMQVFTEQDGRTFVSANLSGPMLARNSNGISIHFELRKNESGRAEYVLLGVVDPREGAR